MFPNRRVERCERTMTTDAASVACSISPLLAVRNGPRAVEFYKSAFGAVEVYRVEDSGGGVVSRLSVDGAEFWVADESPENNNFSPETLGGGTVRMILTVADPDRMFARAVSMGAAGGYGRRRRLTGGAWAAWLIRSGIIGRLGGRYHDGLTAMDSLGGSHATATVDRGDRCRGEQPVVSTLAGLPKCHGGREYERLESNGKLILQLHNFDVEHHHGPIGDRNDKPYGNGVLLWFEIDDFDAAVARAAELKARGVFAEASQPARGRWRPEPLGNLDARPGRLYCRAGESGWDGGVNENDEGRNRLDQTRRRPNDDTMTNPGTRGRERLSNVNFWVTTLCLVDRRCNSRTGCRQDAGGWSGCAG